MFYNPMESDDFDSYCSGGKNKPNLDQLHMFTSCKNLKNKNKIK